MNWQSREDERVARALDGALPSGDAAGVVALTALAERIRAVPADTGLDADPEFRDTLRARLQSAGAALLPHPRVPADGTPAAEPGLALGFEPADLGGRTGRPAADRARPAPPPPARDAPPPARPGPASRRSTRPRGRTVTAAGMLVVATLSVSTVAASSGARPGDPLYGIKRKVQGVELTLTHGDVERGRAHLGLARTRLRELDTAGVFAPPAPLVATLADMDSQTAAGVQLLSEAAVRRTDRARLAELDGWAGQQRTMLVAAQPRLPDRARTRAAESIALLGTLLTRLQELRAALGCQCPAAAPVTDLRPPATTPSADRATISDLVTGVLGGVLDALGPGG